MKILLLEDNMDIKKLIIQVLQNSGHTITWFESPVDLQGALEFDLVIIDNQMPGMTGIEFLRALRAKGNSIPVIMQTSDTDYDLVQEVRGPLKSKFISKSHLIDLEDEIEKLAS